MDVKLICKECGIEFYRRKGEFNRNKKLSRNTFCSQSCQVTYCNKNQRTKESFKNCISSLNSKNRLDEFSPFKRHLTQAKSHSKNKNREITITLQDLKDQWEKQDGKCPYTKMDMIIKRGSSHPYQASLDRIDSSKGYIPGNIMFISLIAQYAKNSWTFDVVIDFCQKVANSHNEDSQ